MTKTSRSLHRGVHREAEPGCAEGALHRDRARQHEAQQDAGQGDHRQQARWAARAARSRGAPLSPLARAVRT